jgi:type III secretory pathway component EscT
LIEELLGQKLMPNPKLITQIINSCVLELIFIVTSHFLDGGLKFIVNSLDECLEGCKHITLVNKKEHSSVSSEIIHNHKSIFISTNASVRG